MDNRKEMSRPGLFLEEFVYPAIELFRRNISVKHLAVHAISQVDILAEVLALETRLCGRSALPRDELTDYRNALGNREPILAIIRDAHDSHKHGELGRKTALAMSNGQRPETKVKAAFFAGVSRAGGPLRRFKVLVYTLDDGTRWEVHKLLFEAHEAWRREFSRLGLPWPPSPYSPIATDQQS